jgi:hypothetical protein
VADRKQDEPSSHVAFSLSTALLWRRQPRGSKIRTAVVVGSGRQKRSTRTGAGSILATRNRPKVAILRPPVGNRDFARTGSQSSVLNEAGATRGVSPAGMLGG